MNPARRLRNAIGSGVIVLLLVSTGCQIQGRSPSSQAKTTSSALTQGGSSSGSGGTDGGVTASPSATPTAHPSPAPTLMPPIPAVAECLSLCANEPTGICNCEESAVMQIWSH